MNVISSHGRSYYQIPSTALDDRAAISSFFHYKRKLVTLWLQEDATAYSTGAGLLECLCVCFNFLQINNNGIAQVELPS